MFFLPPSLWELVGAFLMNRDVPHLLQAWPSVWRERPRLPLVWNGKVDCPPTAPCPVQRLEFSGLPQHAWGRWGSYKVRIHTLCTATMPHLVHLDVSNTLIKSLLPIKHCTQLQHIKCEYTPVYSLAGVEWCPALQSVHCAFTNVCNLRPLRQSTELRHLDCRHTKVCSLLPLMHCPLLRVLCCDHTRVTSFAGLDKCTLLESLSCRSWRPSVVQLLPLRACARLSTLDVTIECPAADCTQWPRTNVGCLRACARLRALRLMGHRVSGVRSLARLQLQHAEMMVSADDMRWLRVCWPQVPQVVVASGGVALASGPLP